MIRENLLLGLTAAVVCVTPALSVSKKLAIATPRVNVLSLVTSRFANDIVNPRFTISVDQARKAFDDFELKGEKGDKINLGEVHSVNVTAQGPQGPLPTQQTLSLRFLPPLDQARKFGYEFGLVAKNRTPADRKDFEDRIVQRIVDHSNQAVFIVKLLPVLFASAANEPIISFVLLDQNANSIDPSKKPDHYVASDKDLFDAVALEKDGQELIFPVTNGSVPRITNKMDKMTLIVEVDGQKAKLDYSLKP